MKVSATVLDALRHATTDGPNLYLTGPRMSPTQYQKVNEVIDEYAAAMQPAVGAALADLLEREARTHDAGVIAAGQVFADDPAGRDAWIAGQTNSEALAVARALLGGGDQ
jgi:hypothetical protein